MTHVSAEEWFPIGAPGIVRPRVGGRAMGSPPRGGPGNGSAPTWRAGQWFAPHVGGRGKMPPPPRGGPGNDSPHVGVRGNASARTWGSVEMPPPARGGPCGNAFAPTWRSAKMPSPRAERPPVKNTCFAGAAETTCRPVTCAYSWFNCCERSSQPRAPTDSPFLRIDLLSDRRRQNWSCSQRFRQHQ